MKKVILAAAFVMGLATVSFAGNPKGETKAEVPTESKATAGTTLYWYQVTYIGSVGTVTSGTPIFAHDEQSNVNPPCEDGNTRDCLRGFVNPQPSGSTASGDAQIKTDEQP